MPTSKKPIVTSDGETATIKPDIEIPSIDLTPSTPVSAQEKTPIMESEIQMQEATLDEEMQEPKIDGDGNTQESMDSGIVRDFPFTLTGRNLPMSSTARGHQPQQVFQIQFNCLF